ncbi:MAG: invasion associated locus B family protein [Pseudomonadota bacterium]
MVFGSRTLRAALAAATTVVAMAAAPAPATAQTAESVDAKRDWSIFQQGSGADRQCWIVSKPTSSAAKRDGKPVTVNRGDIFLMVSIRPADRVKNEVSMISGYPFRKGSSVSARVGSSRFEMFTEGEGAWTDSPESDEKMVDAMRRGSTAVIVGTSTRGTETTDSFSLLGFTAALNEARALCQ